MSKRILGVVLAMAVSAPVLAVGEEESPSVYCAEEARDAGIIDESEIRAYVADCVEQIKQEMAQDSMMQQEGAPAEGGEPIEQAEIR